MNNEQKRDMILLYLKEIACKKRDIKKLELDVDRYLKLTLDLNDKLIFGDKGDE